MSTDGQVVIHEGHPPLAPGHCYLCMSVGGDGRKFIDFHKQVKKYGRVYFCSYCFEEVNAKLGWVSPANFDVCELQAIKQAELIETLKEDNAKLASAVGSSIPNLISDLSGLLEKSSTPKRGPGRPKKSESGTA